MSRWAALLVITLVVALLTATAGCIEVKDKPARGPFIIELDSYEMFFVDDIDGVLVGPHGHLETEIPHAHEGYAWDIEGLGEFKGAEVELPDHAPGVRKASYDIHFFEEENHTGLSVATVPDLSGIYFVIGDGTGLATEDNSTHHAVLDMVWGPNLTEVHADDHGAIMEYGGRLSESMELVLTLNDSTTQPSSYIIGIHVKSGDLLEEDIGSIRIDTDEVHTISYLDGELSVRIQEVVDGTPLLPPIYDGPYADLPKAYRTHIGQMEWVGHVGEPEETPGFGMLLSVLSLAVIAVVYIKRQR